MCVLTGSSNQLRILIGLGKCQQMHRLVENEIPSCSVSLLKYKGKEEKAQLIVY